MKKLLFTVMCFLLVGSAHALMLQWDGTQWPNGSLSQSYTIGGTTLDMQFSGAVGSLIDNHSVAYNKALPTDNWNRNYWSSPAPEGLWYGIKQTVTESSPLQLTISFSAPVTELQFSLYDLDGQEVIILAAELAGASVNPSLVSPGAISYTPATGRLYGNGITGDPGATNNTATILFNDAVDKLILSYSGPSGTGLMLGNIHFIPEPATLGMLLLGVCGLLRQRRSR